MGESTTASKNEEYVEGVRQSVAAYLSGDFSFADQNLINRSIKKIDDLENKYTVAQLQENLPAYSELKEAVAPYIEVKQQEVEAEREAREQEIVAEAEQRDLNMLQRGINSVTEFVGLGKMFEASPETITAVHEAAVGEPPQTQTQEQEVSYTVKPGDNLWKISEAHLKQANPVGDISNSDIAKNVERIAKLNDISNPDLIQSGQELKLPQIEKPQYLAQAEQESERTQVAGGEHVQDGQAVDAQAVGDAAREQQQARG